MQTEEHSTGPTEIESKPYTTLFTRLQKRGYINQPIESAILDEGDFPSESFICNQLELDRRCVFLSWYGEEKAKAFGSNLPLYIYHMSHADSDYRHYYCENAIDYILTREGTK